MFPQSHFGQDEMNPSNTQFQHYLEDNQFLYRQMLQLVVVTLFQNTLNHNNLSKKIENSGINKTSRDTTIKW